MVKNKYACLGCGYIYEEVLKKDKYFFNETTGSRCGSRPMEGTVKEQGIKTYRECPKCKKIVVIEFKPDGHGAKCLKCNKGKLVRMDFGGGPPGSTIRQMVCSNQECSNECNVVRSRIKSNVRMVCH